MIRENKFRIEVRASPATKDHEVLFFADDIDLIQLFAHQKMGLDPNEVLVEPCSLRALDSAHMATIARCGCGVVGCSSKQVQIHHEGGIVWWTEVYANLTVEFEASQYNLEIERALNDHSWETPERTASRLIAAAIDKGILKSHGFTFLWASVGFREGMMTATLELERFQV